MTHQSIRRSDVRKSDTAHIPNRLQQTLQLPTQSSIPFHVVGVARLTASSSNCGDDTMVINNETGTHKHCIHLRVFC